MPGNLINVPGCSLEMVGVPIALSQGVEGALMLGVPHVSARAKRGQSCKYTNKSMPIVTISRNLNV